MNPLRIILIVLGCTLIALNMWRMTDAEAVIAPRTSDVLELLSIYVSRLYLLLAGIICLAISGKFQDKVKSKQVV